MANSEYSLAAKKKQGGLIESQVVLAVHRVRDKQG